MSTLKKVYLDLDRTLFRTDDAGAIWRLLATHYPSVPDAEEAIARSRDFFVFTENGDYFYDWVRQVESYGVAAEEARQAILKSSLADGRFEYPGVAETVRYVQDNHFELAILTFGEQFYQQEIKAALCPSLIGVEIITTMSPKEQFFTDRQNPALLLDDKPISGALPPWVHFVQSVGYNGVEAPSNVEWDTVSSLAEFRDMLERR
ncbi:MAG TPA: hypothetical protein PKD19_03360 [Candidatus Saccharibacteria bacterium]|nr:hypothetical protein [Candidatus Saccharibacteria bacterium]HMR38060.1 hypothetical protein [Candidatus Saccharibacteria bacterium]